ncbi:protein NIM1-INTERACTING 3 [Gastrolobium bilobum]|uniref:protein NIM1-INTERACTING 3 n=1 Tax=Gastrolobium bilobum TaxID=150636 RepID=UPI002AB27376|nr:protein NIM1-INTERACTING 3 [Gastrolobium bilobum]
MEGERRKRKIIENEEESEEQQLEKFFALIKSTKDIRDRLSKEKEEEKAKGVWNPTFQPEDFIDDVDLTRINILHQPAAGPSGQEKEKDDVHKESPEAAAAAAAATPLEENENENRRKASDKLDLTLSL